MLEKLRLAEIDLVIELLRTLAPPKARILEIGGGRGWQAKRLTDEGYDVSSIDVAQSHLIAQAVFPVAIYDGQTIPFGDNEFDVVYSSNVLEHIPHIDAFQREMLRALKPGGIGLHLLPTATWRLWTSLVHYPALVTSLRRKLRGDARPAGEDVPRGPVIAGGAVSIGTLVRRALIPTRHGEFGNTVSELYYFSRLRWTKAFIAAGWALEQRGGNGLFYTGHDFFGRRISLSVRRRLAGVLGNSCHVFVLRKLPR